MYLVRYIRPMLGGATCTDVISLLFVYLDTFPMHATMAFLMFRMQTMCCLLFALMIRSLQDNAIYAALAPMV